MAFDVSPDILMSFLYMKVGSGDVSGLGDSYFDQEYFYVVGGLVCILVYFYKVYVKV